MDNNSNAAGKSIFQIILQMINHLGCILQHDELDRFISRQNEDDREFRLSGKYGFGFKLKKRSNILFFDQYLEDETKESVVWIKEHNHQLEALCSLHNFEL